MKKIGTFFLVVGFLCWAGEPLFPQEAKKNTEAEVRTDLQTKAPSYNPAGRRDPFKNLLAGKELKEKAAAGQTPQLFIDDVHVIGISKSKNRFTAIVNGPQGFPYYLRIGDKLGDGFILSISENQVVFRKVNERGIPLIKPRDITKEINTEER